MYLANFQSYLFFIKCMTHGMNIFQFAFWRASFLFLFFVVQIRVISCIFFGSSYRSLYVIYLIFIYILVCKQLRCYSCDFWLSTRIDPALRSRAKLPRSASEAGIRGVRAWNPFRCPTRLQTGPGPGRWTAGRCPLACRIVNKRRVIKFSYAAEENVFINCLACERVTNPDDGYKVLHKGAPGPSTWVCPVLVFCICRCEPPPGLPF